MAIQFGFNTEEALHSYHYSINDLCVKAPAENVEKQEGEGLDQETAKKVMTTVPKHLKIVGHCIQKGEGEDQNSDVNPTLTATDSSDCLGIISALHDVDDIGIFSVEDRELSHTSSSFEDMGPLLRSSSINSTGSNSDRISDHFFVTETHAENSLAFLGINQDVMDASDPYEQAARAQSHHFRGKLAELYDSGVLSDDPLTEENLHFNGGVLQSSSSSSSSISTAEESFSSSRKRKQRNESDIEDPAASSQNQDKLKQAETTAPLPKQASQVEASAQPLKSISRARRNHKNYDDDDLINLLQCWKYLYVETEKHIPRGTLKDLSTHFDVNYWTALKHRKAMKSCLDSLLASQAAKKNPEERAKDIETTIQDQSGLSLDILRKAMEENPQIDPKAITDLLLARRQASAELLKSTKETRRNTRYDRDNLINLLQCWKYLYLEKRQSLYGMKRFLNEYFDIHHATSCKYTKAMKSCLDSLLASQAAKKNLEEIAKDIETTIQQQKSITVDILREAMKGESRIDPKAITDQLFLVQSEEKVKQLQDKRKKAEKTARLPKQASQGTRALNQAARDPYESSSSSRSSISTVSDPTAYVHLAFLNELENKQVNDFLRRQPDKIQTVLIDHLNHPHVFEDRQVVLRARKALLIECHFLLQHLKWHPRTQQYLKNALPLDKSRTQEERFEAFLTYFDPTIHEALRYRQSCYRGPVHAIASRFHIKEHLMIEACQLFEAYFPEQARDKKGPRNLIS